MSEGFFIRVPREILKVIPYKILGRVPEIILEENTETITTGGNSKVMFEFQKFL